MYLLTGWEIGSGRADSNDSKKSRPSLGHFSSMLRGSRDLIIDQTENTQGFRDTDMILVYLSMNHDMCIAERESCHTSEGWTEGERGVTGVVLWKRKCQEKKKEENVRSRRKCQEKKKMSGFSRF